MAEMDMRIETTESTRAKIAEKMGLDQPSVFDVVNRARYATEDAYLETHWSRENVDGENPDYQAARRKLASEYRERQRTGAAHGTGYGIQRNSRFCAIR